MFMHVVLRRLTHSQGAAGHDGRFGWRTMCVFMLQT